jgi:hypothetical protein
VISVGVVGGMEGPLRKRDSPPFMSFAAQGIGEVAREDDPSGNHFAGNAPGPVNEVSGVTACCSVLLVWLSRSTGIRLPGSWESPLPSESGRTSKSKFEGNWSMAE